MAVYVISYDLNAPGKDYQALYDELDRLGASRILLSQHAVNRTNTDAAGFRDHLWTFMDTNDRLLVMARNSGNWAGMNLITKLSAK